MSGITTTELADLFQQIRSTTLSLTAPLGAEDMAVQSMPDASPAKWHLAHTTWFFEEFLLQTHAPGFQWYRSEFRYLFNSYYETVGERHARPRRGLLTRPSADDVVGYRRAVDEAVMELLTRPHSDQGPIADIITLGLHHEMQHQELLLTDILHAFSCNPLLPAAMCETTESATGNGSEPELAFRAFDGGIVCIGAEEKGFSYDCERPRHQVLVNSFELANRPITNREWLQFMQDGGYHTPTLWLSDGWNRCRREDWEAPLYWRNSDDGWLQFGLAGLRPLNLSAPVCHISYFEADAFARWAGNRLATEQEWEQVAAQTEQRGNFLSPGRWRPQPATGAQGIQQLYGDVWEWTQSPFTAYPGFKVADGAIGEYNGKFMCGQFSLRGGSCVTPEKQIRPSYRNFFYPHQRWQFTGLRLARDS